MTNQVVKTQEGKKKNNHEALNVCGVLEFVSSSSLSVYPFLSKALYFVIYVKNVCNFMMKNEYYYYYYY